MPGREEVPEEAYRLAEGAITHGIACSGGEPDPGVLAELAVDAAAPALLKQGAEEALKALVQEVEAGGKSAEDELAAARRQGAEEERERRQELALKALRYLDGLHINESLARKELRDAVLAALDNQEAF